MRLTAEGVYRRSLCTRCSTFTDVYLRRKINSDGSEMVFEVCIVGGKPHRLEARTSHLSRAEVIRKGIRISDIPLIANEAKIECQVVGCDEPGVQWHHWAPRSIWGEQADDWPGALLCRTHHAEWHKRTGVALGNTK